MTAGVDQTADADAVPDVVAGDVGADLGDDADDLVAGHHREGLRAQSPLTVWMSRSVAIDAPRLVAIGQVREGTSPASPHEPTYFPRRLQIEQTLLAETWAFEQDSLAERRINSHRTYTDVTRVTPCSRDGCPNVNGNAHSRRGNHRGRGDFSTC